jgi:hypothetical protein
VQGNERYTRGGRQAGQFVGTDTSDLPSFLTNLARDPGVMNNNLRGKNGQGRNGQNANANANAQSGRGGGGRAGQNKAKYRVARNADFDYELPPATDLSAHVGTHLKSLSSVKAMGPLDVYFQDRTLVLRGSVATAHDRVLAEKLALLEAGVDRVQNELTVAPPKPAAPAALPAAAPTAAAAPVARPAAAPVAGNPGR